MRILLDTNYLIRCLVADSGEWERVSNWSKNGEQLATSAICWHEFLCGPVTEQQSALVLSLLQGGILPLGEDEAAEAAKLFNAVNRQRALRVDCLIAATAIVAGVSLATSNQKEFEKFAAYRLALV